jgi:hypothetical protein
MPFAIGWRLHTVSDLRRSTVLMLATPSSLDNPKGIIDNPANLTQYRYETERFCPICRSSELSQII